MSKSYNIRALLFQRPSMPYQRVALVLSFRSRAQLYERCDTKVIFTKKDVIPVPRHWDPENLILNKRTRWLHNRKWIPVSATSMTPSTTRITCKLQCLFTRMASTGMKSIVNVLHLLYCSVEYLNNCACIWITKDMMND